MSLLSSSLIFDLAWSITFSSYCSCSPSFPSFYFQVDCSCSPLFPSFYFQSDCSCSPSFPSFDSQSENSCSPYFAQGVHNFLHFYINNFNFRSYFKFRILYSGIYIFFIARQDLLILSLGFFNNRLVSMAVPPMILFYLRRN